MAERPASLLILNIIQIIIWVATCNLAIIIAKLQDPTLEFE
jgi:hypothetical protein